METSTPLLVTQEAKTSPTGPTPEHFFGRSRAARREAPSSQGGKQLSVSTMTAKGLFPLQPTSKRLVNARRSRRKAAAFYSLGSRNVPRSLNLSHGAYRKSTNNRKPNFPQHGAPFFRFSLGQTLELGSQRGLISETVASVWPALSFATQFNPRTKASRLQKAVNLSASTLISELGYSHGLQMRLNVCTAHSTPPFRDTPVCTPERKKLFNVCLFSSLTAGISSSLPFGLPLRRVSPPINVKVWGSAFWYSAWRSRRAILHGYNMAWKSASNSFFAFLSYPTDHSLRRSIEPIKAIPDLPFALRGMFSSNSTPSRALSLADLITPSPSPKPRTTSIASIANPTLYLRSGLSRVPAPKFTKAKFIGPEKLALLRDGASTGVSQRHYLTGTRRAPKGRYWVVSGRVRTLRRKLRRLGYLIRKSRKKSRRKLREWKRLTRKLPRSARLSVFNTSFRSKAWRRLRKPKSFYLNVLKKKALPFNPAVKPVARVVLRREYLMSNPFFARTLADNFSLSVDRLGVYAAFNLTKRAIQGPERVIQPAPTLRSVSPLPGPAIWFTDSSEFWGNPKLIKYFLLWFWNIRGNNGLDGPLNCTSPRFTHWARRLQNSMSPVYFGEQRPLLRKSNLWTTSISNFTIRKTLFRRMQNLAFKPTLSAWYYKTLTSFMESVSGRHVALNFGPFVESALTFEDRALCATWYRRVVGFQKMLGHKIFAREALLLIAISLRLKDPTFLANWIRGMLKRLSFWKFRLLFRYLKFVLQHLFRFSFGHFHFRGLKLRLKGKISVAGNARTRTLVYRVGDTSHSKMSNRVAYDLSFINTFTGVLGFKLWFFF